MTDVFDARWLELREPVDHRSRASVAASIISRAWGKHGWMRIVDLGSGTGSNVRYLSPRLPKPQQWTLVDRDSGLLDTAKVPSTAGAVTSIVHDLALAVAEDITEAGADLVTASAFLDLVSAEWLAKVIQTCCSMRCGVYFPLTYDGTIQWHTAADDPRPVDDPDDAAVRRAVNSHQRQDKGFGPALGPMASLHAEAGFRAEGYRVWLLQSRWCLGPSDAALVRMLIDGWEQAALELDHEEEELASRHRYRAWAARRREVVSSGHFGLSVGHLDLVALPGDA